MTTYSALSPVAVGVKAALSVSSVTSLATGGVGDDVQQTTAFPYVLYEVSDDSSMTGFGTQPGRPGFLSNLRVRINCFSQYGGGKEVRAICAACIGAFLVAFDKDNPTVTITGHKLCDFVWQNQSEPIDSIVNAVKVKEVVADFAMRVELT